MDQTTSPTPEQIKPQSPPEVSPTPAAPVTPVQPSAQATVIASGGGSSRNTKLLIFIGVFLALVLIVSGGAYFYINSLSQSNNSKISQKTQAENDEDKAIASELSSMEIEDVDKEFTEVDKDLQEL